MFTTTTALCISFLFHHLFMITAATTAPLYKPHEYILLDCGSSSNASSGVDRNWQGDANSIYLPSDGETKSTVSHASSGDPSFTQRVPYMTARIFHSQFTYTISELTTGPKFIRLYFYPIAYASLNKGDPFLTQDYFFSVIANNYTLLSNFSAFLTVSYSSRASLPTLVKEYIIYINDDDDHRLNITFLPSPSSYAFVNGIELVSVPDNLYYPGNDVQVKWVGQRNGFFNIPNDGAFETVYRLNVGGSDVQVTEDTGMFRAWYQDFDYVGGFPTSTGDVDDVTVNHTLHDAPPYTAPEIVYTTARYMKYNFSRNYNMTWFFSVDSGFYYLLRLHFCEFFQEITERNQRVFTIFIRNQTAELEADVIAWGNGPYVAVKKDYITYVADPDGRQSKQDLWLAMHPSSVVNSKYDSALLNGLEIFKLSEPNGSLAAPNPSPFPILTTPDEVTLREGKKRKSWPLVLAVSGGVGLLISSLSFLIIFGGRKKVKDLASKNTAN